MPRDCELHLGRPRDHHVTTVDAVFIRDGASADFAPHPEGGSPNANTGGCDVRGHDGCDLMQNLHDVDATGLYPGHRWPAYGLHPQPPLTSPATRRICTKTRDSPHTFNNADASPIDVGRHPGCPLEPLPFEGASAFPAFLLRREPSRRIGSAAVSRKIL